MKSTLEIVKDDSCYSRSSKTLYRVRILFKYNDMLFHLEMYEYKNYDNGKQRVDSVVIIDRMIDEYTKYDNSEHYYNHTNYKLSEYMDCIDYYCHLIDTKKVILDFPKTKLRPRTILEEIESMVNFSEIEWALIIDNSNNGAFLKKDYSSIECETYKNFLNQIYTQNPYNGVLLWRGNFMLKDGDYISLNNWSDDYGEHYYWKMYSYPKYPEGEQLKILLGE